MIVYKEEFCRSPFWPWEYTVCDYRYVSVLYYNSATTSLRSCHNGLNSCLNNFKITLNSYFEDIKNPLEEEFIMFELEYNIDIRWFLFQVHHPTFWSKFLYTCKKFFV